MHSFPAKLAPLAALLFAGSAPAEDMISLPARPEKSPPALKGENLKALPFDYELLLQAEKPGSIYLRHLEKTADHIKIHLAHAGDLAEMLKFPVDENGQTHKVRQQFVKNLETALKKPNIENLARAGLSLGVLNNLMTGVKGINPKNPIFQPYADDAKVLLVLFKDNKEVVSAELARFFDQAQIDTIEFCKSREFAPGS